MVSSIPRRRSFPTFPRNMPISSIFVDESGSKNSRGHFFVIGCIKVRDQAKLCRDIRGLRQKYNFHKEIKFSSIRVDELPFYFDLVECIAEANVRIGASVYDSRLSFDSQIETWRQQAHMTKQLIIGMTNKGEVLNVFLDLVQTPQGSTVADSVKADVNRKFGSKVVLEAYDTHSDSTDLLQVADLVASSIGYYRNGSGAPKPGHPKRPPKFRLMSRFYRALELDNFEDVRKGKVNILTMNTSSATAEIPNFPDTSTKSR